MDIYVIKVVPEPQKKTRFANRGGRIFTYNPSAKYEESIRKEIKKTIIEYNSSITPIEAPVFLRINLFLPIPKSTPKKKKMEMLSKRIHHIKKPDVDNLAYPIVNALKGILYKDDSQIVELHASKFYSETPHVEIYIKNLQEEEL